MRLLEENLAAEEEKKKADLGVSNDREYTTRTPAFFFARLDIPSFETIHILHSTLRSQLAFQDFEFPLWC